jgi:hypothetical protein
MTLDEARGIVANFESARLRAVTGKTAYEIFANDNGITLVADAVSRIVKAQRVIERHEREQEAK